jgi:hypothetical protein
MMFFHAKKVDQPSGLLDGLWPMATDRPVVKAIGPGKIVAPLLQTIKVKITQKEIIWHRYRNVISADALHG